MLRSVAQVLSIERVDSVTETLPYLILSLLSLIMLLGMVDPVAVAITSQLTSKAVTWFKPDPHQPRKHVDEADLQRLGKSLIERQIEPLQAKSDGIIIDGWRRWLAAMKVGLEKLDVIITDQPLTDNQLRSIRLTSFFHKADLTPAEKWQACAELMAANPTWGMQDLSRLLHIDPSMVTRLLSPSKCIVPWQDALKSGQVGISDCYCASKLPEEEQAGLLALKRSGASRDAIEQAGRKKRNGTMATQVKVSKVKIAMPGGVTIQITGKDLSMAEIVDLLAEILKEARKCAEQYDVKTFQSMMKDKAKG